MFSNAKVGDRVWSFANGWGTVVDAGKMAVYGLDIDFDNGEQISFTFEGKFSTSDENPTLFWDEIKYEIPVKPKCRTKKWITLFWHKDRQEWWVSGHRMIPTLFDSLEEAEKDAKGFPHLCVHNEIEIEE